MTRCPRGHDTAAADYCDECGSPLSVLAGPAAESPASAGNEPCPECETTQAGQYKRIEANQPVPLADGDQVFLGAWTTLTLSSRLKKRRGIQR
jgi:hypothetical protein